jgi:hypothetical protein
VRNALDTVCAAICSQRFSIGPKADLKIRWRDIGKFLRGCLLKSDCQLILRWSRDFALVTGKTWAAWFWQYEIAGTSSSQEEPGGTRSGGARESQEEPGGARRSQEELGGARRSPRGDINGDVRCPEIEIPLRFPRLVYPPQTASRLGPFKRNTGPGWGKPR